MRPLFSGLSNVVDKLAHQFPIIGRRALDFQVFQCFREKAYDKILYLDSDILCRGNILALFESEEDLLVAPDLYYYRDYQRCKNNFALVREEDRDQYEHFDRSFNSGVILIGNKFLKDQVFNDLVCQIPFQAPKMELVGHTDQMILNYYFEGKVSYLDPSYNYLIKAKEVLKQRERLSVSEAKFIHFLQGPKPWDWEGIKKSVEKRQFDPEGYAYWYSACIAYCIKAYLKTFQTYYLHWLCTSLYLGIFCRLFQLKAFLANKLTSIKVPKSYMPAHPMEKAH